MVHITSAVVVASILVSSVLAVPISHVDLHKDHTSDIVERTIHAHKKHHKNAHPEQTEGHHHHQHSGSSTTVPATHDQQKLNKRTVHSEPDAKPHHHHRHHTQHSAPSHHQQTQIGTTTGSQQPERHHEQFKVRADEVQAFARAFNDIDIEEISARDPSLGSFFKKIKKTVSHIATPKNLATAAAFAPLILRSDDAELLGRAVEHPSFQRLAERDPSFGSFFKKIKKAVGHIATPSNLMKAASFAPLILREDEMDAFKRAIADDDQVGELAARDPSLGSFFKKVKKVATPNNIMHAADMVSKFIPREDIDSTAEVLQRDVGSEVTHDMIERNFVEYDLDKLD